MGSLAHLVDLYHAHQQEFNRTVVVIQQHISHGPTCGQGSAGNDGSEHEQVHGR